jgi:NAD(P)-dependent dehydrogenase (short-subunit alcohol dehydrogenase family)
VVCVSSTGHRGGEIQFDNLQLEGIYTPGLGYAQAKLANIYMANELDRRYGSKNLHGFSLHPGGIWSGLQVHMGEEVIAAYKKNEQVRNHMLNAEQGAATTVWAAVGKEWEGKGGKYLEFCQVSPPVKDDFSPIDVGYAPYAYDEVKEGRLWKKSLELVGLEDDQ